MVLVCALPFAVLALERSLSSEEAFSSLLGAIRSPLGRAAMVLIAWACAHHLFAGIRHLLSDVGVGASLAASRRSAYAVLIAAAALAAAALQLAFGSPASFERWQAWGARPLGAVILLVLAGALIVHAWVGLRDVVLDYVHPLGLRLAVLGVAATGLAGLAGWTLLIVARHAVSHTAL